jgi:phosphatidylglycerophosphatase A
MGHHSNTKYAEKIAGLPKPANTWPKWVVSGGGLGLLRPAPGSWGTLGPAMIYYVALLLGAQRYFVGLGIGLLMGALVTGVILIRLGFWACCFYRKVDPGQVVLDEFAGFFITAAFLPIPAWFQSDPLHLWYWAAILFVLFRLTDTLKLPPGRQLEALPWGWGILLDDVAAGIQANIVMQIVVQIVARYAHA